MSASSKKKLRKEQAAAQMTEKQQAEQKEAKKLKLYTIGFVALIAVVLCVAIVVMVSQGISNSGIVEKNSTAVQIGEHKLNTVDLSYYYVDAINQIYSEWYSYYGDHTSMYVGMLYGLDMTKPLDEQYYDTEGKVTWAEYFANVAIENARSNYALYDLAIADGHEMTESEKSSVSSSITYTELEAIMTYQFPDLDSYLKSFYSRGASRESYTEYMNIAALASSYYNAHSESLSYDDAAIRAYDNEHTKEFNSYTYASYLMTYSDFLDKDAKNEDGEYTDEQIEAALKAAKAAADTLASGTYDSNEDLQAAIKLLSVYAEKNVTLSEQDELLYSSINSKLVEWVSDDSRKPGEMGVVPYTYTKTDDEGNESTVTDGYYIIRFEGKTDNTVQLKNVRHILSQFEGGTTDSTTGQTVYTEAEKQAAKAAIEAVQQKWTEDGATEDAFIALVKDNTDDSGSSANGGLYEDVYPGQMVTAFEDWCFDEARKAGDTDIVESEYGYHFMYFVGDSDMTYRDYMIESTLHSNDMQAWIDGILENVKAENIDISKLNLDLVMQSAS